jgi:hypothetical protein
MSAFAAPPAKRPDRVIRLDRLERVARKASSSGRRHRVSLRECAHSRTRSQLDAWKLNHWWFSWKLTGVEDSVINFVYLAEDDMKSDIWAFKIQLPRYSSDLSVICSWRMCRRARNPPRQPDDHVQESRHRSIELYPLEGVL